MNTTEQVTVSEVLNACFDLRAVSLLRKFRLDVLNQNVGVC